MKKIPDDEMLLAEMIAAAKSRGLKHCTKSNFRNSNGDQVHSIQNAASCCALGARELLGLYDFDGWMASGNDYFLHLVDPLLDPSNEKERQSFDIGYTFALAMQEEPSDQ
jgi:hypothetical protein